MSNLYSPRDIVKSGLCIGCGSCVGQTNSHDVEMKFDKYGQMKPNGNKSWYHHKNAQFSQTCPFSPTSANEDEIAYPLYANSPQRSVGLGFFEKAYVGHVTEDEYRMQGSSGGMVTWVATELMKQGLIDGIAHVVATADPQHDGRYFRYRISRTEEEVRAGAKSRYYPIEMSEILNTIREVPGRYAIVGIPCFIKAINLLRMNDPVMQERIRFTLGLFCGHMKSARFIESFAWQMNVPVNQVKQVEFRNKDAGRPANWYTAKLTLHDGTTVLRDWWHLADGDWGAGFFMNNACNYCDDVVAETSDISFGDAWVEPYSSDGRGTNVVVVRSSIVHGLVDKAIQEQRLALHEVNAGFVEQTQAAGFRQRREGLAYRMSWSKKGVKPVKRFYTAPGNISRQRRMIYRIRYNISKWSHHFSRIAHQTNVPQIYIRWATAASAVYHGLAYQRGTLGKFIKRIGFNQQA